MTDVTIKNHELFQWDDTPSEDKLASIRLNVTTDRLFVDVEVVDAEGNPDQRSIRLETDEEQTLRVMIYGAREDEPYTVLVPLGGDPKFER